MLAAVAAAAAATGIAAAAVEGVLVSGPVLAAGKVLQLVVSEDEIRANAIAGDGETSGE